MVTIESIIYTYLWSILTLFSYIFELGVSKEWILIVIFWFGLIGSIVILLAIILYAIPIHCLLQRYVSESVWGYLLASLGAGPVFILILNPGHDLWWWLIVCQAISTAGAIAFWWYQIGQYRYSTKRRARIIFYSVEIAILAIGWLI